MTSSGGETREDPSGWTTDTLRMYMQTQLDQMSQRLDERYETQRRALDTAFAAQKADTWQAMIAQKEAVQAALLSAKEAVATAQVADEKRFDSVNEFRAQLADQARTFMPRNEAVIMSDRNTERLKEVSAVLAEFITRTEVEQSILRVGERFQDLATRTQELVSRPEYTAMVTRMTEQLQALNDRALRSEGKGQGFTAGWGILVAVIGVIGTIVTIGIILQGGG